MINERILAIETSAHAASCALYANGKLEASAYQEVGLTHSRTLLPMVRDMLANAGFALADCRYIAVANGPGSFTGIRIGVAAAKGLALGAGLECIGVSTLEAMAYLHAHERGVICCAMDARRGEVYNALFRADGSGVPVRLTEDRAVPAALAAAEAAQAVQTAQTAQMASADLISANYANLYDKIFENPIICVGDGAELCYNLLLESRVRLAPPHLLRQNAIGVAFAAAHGSVVSPDGLLPVYLRLSQAERERAERENKR